MSVRKVSNIMLKNVIFSCMKKFGDCCLMITSNYGGNMIFQIFLCLQLVYVMPSTSGRAATYPRRADKLKFFNELKDLTDKKRAELGLTSRAHMYTSVKTGESSSTGADSSETRSSN